MDLRLKDVAELLDVSEATVRRWIADSKIPHYRLNHQFRFNRSEIENWVISARQEGAGALFQEEDFECKMGTQQFGLYRAIYKGGVYDNVEGDSKEQVIRSAMQRIAQDLQLDAEVITELLLDREKLMPTALSSGIGVPHTRDFLLQESYDVVSVVFTKKPIEYGALDHKPVHTLFFLFACDDKRHLHLLAKLAHLASKKDHLSFLKNHPTKQELLNYIKQWESTLHTKETLVCK